VHLVACTQKPTAAVIGGLVKSNFPVRIVGSVGSPEDAKVATGIAGTGAERLLGQGDFLVVAQGQVTRMQAAYVSVGQVRGVVGRLGAAPRPLRLVATSTNRAGSHPAHPPTAGLAERLAERTENQVKEGLKWVKSKRTGG
jgi:DNA segregation ATPase FtsK/SpoIIIE-like protein